MMAEQSILAQTLKATIRSLRSQLSAAKKRATIAEKKLATADCAERDAQFNRERVLELEHRLNDVKEANRKLQETILEKQNVIDEARATASWSTDQATELREALTREKRVVDGLIKLVGKTY